MSWANSVAPRLHGAAGISIGLGRNADEPGDQVLNANSRETLPLNNPSGCVLAATSLKNGAVSRLTTNGSENGLAASQRRLRECCELVARMSEVLRSRFLPGDIPLEILVSPN
jgi:hypothetical protein